MNFYIIIAYNNKKSKKLLTNQNYSSIIHTNLNIAKKDYDEDGRIVKSGESCRLVRGNGETFQWLITSESKDRKRKRVDSFRIAA